MSIYSFVDTNAQPNAIPLPAEAMSFGGVYLENEITGYRTLYVEGRETISASVDYTEIAVRDGARYKRRRYLPRTLVVGFQLIAATPAAFVAAFNKLQSLLSQEQVQIIFADETDKYYVGTKAKLMNIPHGRLAVTSEIEIICSDPFKYAVTETTVEAQTTESYVAATVTVGDTVPADTYYVLADAYTLTSDTVFAAGKTYYTKSGNVYTAATVTAGAAVTANTYYEKTQSYVLTSDATFADGTTYYLKNPDQTVLVTTYNGTYPAHPVLTAQSEGNDNGFYGFALSNGALIQVGDPSETDKVEETNPDNAVTVFNYWWNPGNLNLWTANNAHLLKWSDNYIQTGSVEIPAHYIYAKKPAGSFNYYFGPALKYAFTNEDGAHKSFEFSFKHWFQPTASDGGGFDIYVNKANGDNICGVSIWKDKNADIRWDMFANGKSVNHGTYPLSKNPFAGWIAHRIQKVEARLEFAVGGNKFSITVPELENEEAGEISMIFYFQQNATSMEANNALGQITFRGIPSSWADVYNKIPEGAEVVVDTGSGQITMDGYDAADLGAIGNEYEDFVLTPGANLVVCAASDWVDDAEYSMKYREVYL